MSFRVPILFIGTKESHNFINGDYFVALLLVMTRKFIFPKSPLSALREVDLGGELFKPVFVSPEPECRIRYIKNLFAIRHNI
jgi:hypothetical protein